MYHFAYGSNMNINELKKYILCKNIIIVGIGYLDNHIFRYRYIKNRKLSAKANIEPYKNSKVYGIIFKITGSLNKLHKKEGIFNNTYYIRNYNITLTKSLNITNKKIKCFVYVMEPDRIGDVGKPSKRYKINIIKSATYYNFPSQYIRTKLF